MRSVLWFEARPITPAVTQSISILVGELDRSVRDPTTLRLCDFLHVLQSPSVPPQVSRGRPRCACGSSCFQNRQPAIEGQAAPLPHACEDEHPITPRNASGMALKHSLAFVQGMLVVFDLLASNYGGG